MRKQGQGELAVLSYNSTVRHLLKAAMGSGIQNQWYTFFFNSVL